MPFADIGRVTRSTRRRAVRTVLGWSDPSPSRSLRLTTNSNLVARSIGQIAGSGAFRGSCPPGWQSGGIYPAGSPHRRSSRLPPQTRGTPPGQSRPCGQSRDLGASAAEQGVWGTAQPLKPLAERPPRRLTEFRRRAHLKDPDRQTLRPGVSQVGVMVNPDDAGDVGHSRSR